MVYKALYRKWRPKVFEDVIGQSHIVTTLKNQIKTSSIAHAYLFSGTRGTGKTSTAKIFARAVNCLNRKDSNPCNTCEVCKDIINESIMDVIEIDAASNNGVDNIREIRENVKYPPSKGKYKVYIIDEVHMLSTGAFNALLKTLEEPPPHVIFILATTELHKLPATILSRCQKFDFKPVKIKEITEVLSNICKSMSINAEDNALRLIATHAEGALRDALSLLEQCLAINTDILTYEDVIQALGAVNFDTLIQISNGLIEGKTADILFSIDNVIMDGRDISQLIKDLIQHFRSLLLAKLEADLTEMLNIPNELAVLIMDQSKGVEPNWLIAAIHSLSDIEVKMKYSSNPRTLFEVGIISLCNAQFDNSREGLLERIKHLEKKISSGTFVNNNDIVRDNTVPNYNAGAKKSETKSIPRETINREPQIKDDRLQIVIEGKWEQIIDEIRKEKKASSLALLKEGKLTVLPNNILDISFSQEMEIFKQKLDRDKVKQYISSIIEKHIGQKLEIVLSIQGKNSEETQYKHEKVIEKIKSIVPDSIFEIIEE